MKRHFQVGILFSTSGPYALLGRDAFDGAMLAVAEVNDESAGDLELSPLVADPAGGADRYEPLCEGLIHQGARHVVGGITSWSRKEMIPVVEKRNALLWYPCPYEGFESNDRVIYVGACPNQHIIPLFAHVVPRFGARAYLLGSNYIWGWETNRIARELLNECGGAVLGERYLPLGSEDIGRVIAEIEQSKPDFILNNLIGPSSYAFLAAYADLARKNSDFAADKRPAVSCNLAECELDAIGEAGLGHLTTAVYFDSLDTPENRAFLARMRGRLGPERRVSAFFACAYMAVKMLAEVMRETRSDDPAAVLPMLGSRRFASPMGDLKLDSQNHHVAFRPNLARIAPGRTFEVVHRAAEPVDPDPYLSRFPAEIALLGSRAAELSADRAGLSNVVRLAAP